MEFIREDLDLKELCDIHKHLWLAGLPQCARPLHYQLLLSRNIIVTEKSALHLTWMEDRIFLKPLPDYLMDHSIWETILCRDENYKLFGEANGLMLSYLWLVASRSDFKIAHDCGLLSPVITWERWTAFSKVVAANIDHEHLTNISPRYIYGELRLGRLNWIYRLCSGKRSAKTFIRGYKYNYTRYSTFIERNFAWFLTAIIYITLVLTAMQVGLGTSELRESAAFNRASYGFTIFAILAPLILGLLVGVVLAVLVCFNAVHALTQRKKARTKYVHSFGGTTLVYNH